MVGDISSEANEQYKLKQWWCSRFPMSSPPCRKGSVAARLTDF